MSSAPSPYVAIASHLTTPIAEEHEIVRGASSCGAATDRGVDIHVHCAPARLRSDDAHSGLPSASRMPRTFMNVCLGYNIHTYTLTA